MRTTLISTISVVALSLIHILHKYSDIEVRLNAIEAGQTTQNDAIAEMSEVIYSE